jgi:hypothetical protein
MKKSILPTTILIGAGILIAILIVDPGKFVPSLILVAVCIAQNTASSLVSRARNRDVEAYHAIASVFSNGVWFATMAYMIKELSFDYWVVLPYIVGTVNGSLLGAKISMQIERLLGATSDGHLKDENGKVGRDKRGRFTRARA